MIFFGNGEKSLAEAYFLIKDLIKAFDILNGLQQGYINKEEREELEYEVLAVRKKIFNALSINKDDMLILNRFGELKNEK